MVSARRTTQRTELSSELYINRELSWLEFNRRVLKEVTREETPLLERAKFAAIFAANLDEFFMIRVAGVKRKVVSGITEVAVDGRTPVQQLAAIHRVTRSCWLSTRERCPMLSCRSLPGGGSRSCRTTSCGPRNR